MSSMTCRICGRVFNDPLDVIHIFSDAGKKDNVAAKILYTLTIMITEDDPTSKHICKMCYGHIDFFTRFSNTSRVYNNILMNNYLKEPSNVTYKSEMTRFLSSPVELLCYKQNSDIRGIHESFVNCMKSPVLNERNISKHKEHISQNESANVIQPNKSNKSDHILQTSNPNEKENNNIVNQPNTSNKYDLTLQTSNSNEKENNNIVNQPNTSKKSDHILQTSNPNEKEKNKVCMNIQPSLSLASKSIQPINQSSVRSTVAKPHSSNESNLHKISDEIICLDDDDDGDDDDVQVIENAANAMSNNAQKKRKPRVILKKKSLFTKNNLLNNTHAIALTHLMQFKRRLENASKNSFQPEINIITPLLTKNQQSPISEQMVITPDITLPTIVNTSSCDPSNNIFYPAQFIDNNNSTESTVSPETGFHFLFRSDQTVDLTSSDYTPKNKSQKEIYKNQGNIIKKPQMPKIFIQNVAPKPPPSPQVTIKTKTTSANVPRPKRAQTFTTSESKKIKKSLGPNCATNLLSMSVSLIKLELSLYQCPICEKYFSSTESRQLHENKCHVLPPNLPEKSNKLDPTTCDNTPSASQQAFLTHLNLVKRVSTNLPEHFANRKHFQNALKMYGNVQGKYKCHYCKYETSRLYTLWAHMCVNHIQFNTDMRSNSFCFVCNRTFGKRIKLLKHLDRCVESHLELESSNNPCDEKLACDYSDSEINSLPELEDKLWSLVNV